MPEKLDVLALAAHPDDTELCCSGTLASLVNQGYKTGVIDLTRGEKGTRGTPKQRVEEAQAAAKILGLTIRENLELPDTQLANTREFQKVIIREIRKYRPHICLVNAPGDRHPDHGDAAKLELDAIFYSGLRMITTQDKDGKEQEIWRPAHILHYMQDRPFEPSFVYDVSDTMETKKEAILAFRSQFNLQESQQGDDEPETYISSPRFFNSILGRARHYGHMIGAEYGEPFLYYEMNAPVPLKNFNVFMETSPTR